MQVKSIKVGKLVGGILFMGSIAVLWYGVYSYQLGKIPEGSKVTENQLKEIDEEIGVYYEAKIKVNEKEYDLSDLTKEILGDNVVVDVTVDDRLVQGYVTISDMDLKPRVVLSDEDNYAQVILPSSDR